MTPERITHVYAIMHETDVIGLWTDPQEAVKYYFRYDLKTNDGICLNDNEQLLTVEEATKKMLEPDNDYPYLTKININPADDSDAQNSV